MSMKNLTKEVSSIAEAAKDLVSRIEKLQRQFEKMGKRPPKSAPAKKTAPKKKRTTDVEVVLSVVNRYKKGVDAAAVIEKTGFSRQKVYNAVSQLKKQGRIKGVGYGKYVKA